jgi:hypothetical protein
MQVVNVSVVGALAHQASSAHHVNQSVFRGPFSVHPFHYFTRRPASTLAERIARVRPAEKLFVVRPAEGLSMRCSRTIRSDALLLLTPGGSRPRRGIPRTERGLPQLDQAFLYFHTDHQRTVNLLPVEIGDPFDQGGKCRCNHSGSNMAYSALRVNMGPELIRHMGPTSIQKSIIRKNSRHSDPPVGLRDIIWNHFYVKWFHNIINDF